MGQCNRHLLISIVCLAALTTGCKDKASPYASSGSSPSNGTVTPPSAPTVSATAPLALNIYTLYDNQQYVNNLTFAINGTATTSTICAATAANPVVNCTVSVPEGRMYLSSFHFQFAWMASKCTLMTFQPYYYQRSGSAGYRPPGSTDPIDCSASPIDSACFNGAAVHIVDNFPHKRALLYTPDETNLNQVLSGKADLVSAWSLDMFMNNLLVSNDMPAGKRAADHSSAAFNTALFAASPYYGAYVNSDQYTAVPGNMIPTQSNSFVDYQLNCRDHWYDLQTYTINLTINDEDTDPGSGLPTQNHFATWRDLP